MPLRATSPCERKTGTHRHPDLSPLFVYQEETLQKKGIQRQLVRDSTVTTQQGRRDTTFGKAFKEFLNGRKGKSAHSDKPPEFQSDVNYIQVRAAAAKLRQPVRWPSLLVMTEPSWNLWPSPVASWSKVLIHERLSAR